MPRRLRLIFSPIACLLILLVPVARAQSSGKKKVTISLRPPSLHLSITGSASDLLQADAVTFNAFAAKVKADLDSIFRDYDIRGQSNSAKRLFTARLNLQQAAGENRLALETMASLLGCSRKPIDSLPEKVFVQDRSYRLRLTQRRQVGRL